MEDLHLTGIGMTSQRTRDRLIRRLQEAGIKDKNVLAAMRDIPRHIFVEEALSSRAYEDNALPIGYGQTISQPYIVALMTQTLLNGRERLGKVLEIGTGSGYQAAVLSKVVNTIYTVERISALLNMARKRFFVTKLRNIRAKFDDGTAGWVEHAPYDGIMVTAAAERLPEDLIDQLKTGARLVIPIGPSDSTQELFVYTKLAQGVRQERLIGVQFVPLVEGNM